MMRSLLRSVALATLMAGPPTVGVAQIAPEALFSDVMPSADRFGPRGGDPPVYEAFRSDPATGVEEIVGYVFLTSDLPPERRGYSGPIQALVGIDRTGRLTGVRVVDYYESHLRTLGDFLRTPGFQEQYAGKSLADAFSVNRDVESISRATISVRALSRGVRDAARRVAAVYLELEEEPIEEGADPATLTWLELVRAGFVQQIALNDGRGGTADVSVVHVGTPAFGEYLLGAGTYERAQRSIERRGGAEHLFVYGIDGERLRLFEREGWSVAQDGDTLELDIDDVYSLGLPNAGIIDGQVVLLGAMIVDSIVDVSRPLTLLFDGGARGEPHVLPYRTVEAREAELLGVAGGATAGGASEATVPSSAGEEARTDEEDPVTGEQAGPTRSAAENDSSARFGADPGAAPETVRAVADSGPTVDSTTRPDASADPTAGAGAAGSRDGATVESSLDSAGTGGAPASIVDAEATPSVADLLASESSGALLSDLWRDAAWGRVFAMALVLALALAAFLVKNGFLRAVSLGVTLVYLGFMDGGFLSVTHITSAIWVGPAAFLSDLPLFLIATFTLITTLVWGRVFCGFLCPFGALQDLIDRVVPKRLQRELPSAWHGWALKWKYVVLAVILVPALAGSQAAIYPYFEPFGTVFFFGTSPLLWAIAGTFLAASFVVPRFYCRYACPLGAALAIGSLVTLRRIPRVEQCGHCKVCEQACPTGAISGAAIDFKECVRCNDCEIKLRDRAGVCRHEMDEVRSRLVQISRAPSRAAHDV